jgi:restriction system protein
MKFPKMSENSIFAILLRSPWWISVAVCAALFAALRLAMPELYAFFVALPFGVIGVYAGWAQLRAPSPQRIAAELEAHRAASWDAFAASVAEAFRRDGYEVQRFPGGAADFELVKGGRLSLVACKRWKAARTGVEPLRELHAAATTREAQERIYVVAGEVTANAAAFAGANGIRLIREAELAKLLRG